MLFVGISRECQGEEDEKCDQHDNDGNGDTISTFVPIRLLVMKMQQVILGSCQQGMFYPLDNPGFKSNIAVEL